jgi:cytochrome c biogenesis protein CcmG/thiol:disulfide interchange protein DsbE
MNATTAARRKPAQDRAPGRAQGRIVTLAIMAVTAAVIAAAAFLSNQPASASGVTTVNIPGTATGPAPVVGKPAPPFSSTTADGQPVALADYAGSPIWLTFGASWCQPCRAENPDIQGAYDRYRARGIVVIQVYMAEEAGTVTDYANRVGLTYVKIPDPGYAVADEYRILGIPSHFFIDRTGVLRSLKVGTLDPGTMDQLLDELTG